MAEAKDTGAAGENRFSYEDAGKTRIDWIAQASEAIDTLKDRSRIARSMGLSTDAAPSHSTPFRIDSPVIDEGLMNVFLTDGIEPFEEHFKKTHSAHMTRTFPSGKVTRSIAPKSGKHSPCEVISIDSTGAVGAPEGQRLIATAERKEDNIRFALFEDGDFELVVRDKIQEGDNSEELAYESGKRPLEEMSLPEYEVAMAILQQAWFDMGFETSMKLREEQMREFTRNVIETSTTLSDEDKKKLLQ